MHSLLCLQTNPAFLCHDFNFNTTKACRITEGRPSALFSVGKCLSGLQDLVVAPLLLNITFYTLVPTQPPATRAGFRSSS